MKDELIKIAENIRGIASEIEQIVAEPKEPKPLYEVKKEYWWSGISISHIDVSHPRKVTITAREYKFNQWHYSWGGTWIDESELSPIPQSQHKRGKRFDDKHDYKGVMEIPGDDDVFVTNVGIAANKSRFGLNMNINHGFREILIPHKEERKDRVGEIIEREREFYLSFGLPLKCSFKVLRWGRSIRPGEVFLFGAAWDGVIDFSGYHNGYNTSYDTWILKPLLDKHTVHAWDKDGKPYEFEVEGEPDLDDIYKKTIRKGALAAYIEIDKCVKEFRSQQIMSIVSLYRYETPRFSSCKDTWQEGRHQQLQQAISEYVAKQKDKDRGCSTCRYSGIHSSRCINCNNEFSHYEPEKDEWTVTIGGKKVIIYDVWYNSLLLKWDDGKEYRLALDNIQDVKRTLLALNIPIKPYVEGEKMEKPE